MLTAGNLPFISPEETSLQKAAQKEQEEKKQY